MKKDDIFPLKNRRILYNFIEKFPGVNLTKIVKKLNLSEGTVRYHIKYLEDRGILNIENNDGYTRYYLKNKFKKDEIKILNILRIENCRLILLYLLVGLASSRKQLSLHLDKHPSTIFHYLKKLKKLDIIEGTPKKYNFIKTKYNGNVSIKVKNGNRDVFYTLKDPYAVYDLFIIYQKKLFDDEVIDSLLKIYNFFKEENQDSSDSKKKNFILVDIDTATDRFKDNFFKLFPLPFLS